MDPKQLVESLELKPKQQDELIVALTEGYDKNRLAKLLGIAPAAGNTAVKAAGTEKTLASLSSEQREQAEKTVSAMVEKFSTKDRELTAEDFGVVYYEAEDGKNEAAVMLTTDSGIYMGSYNNIMKNNEACQLDVDGRQVDTRAAMTFNLYKAFIGQAKKDDTDQLPDSSQLGVWTGTWLTGEAPRDRYAGYGYIYLDGQPLHRWYRDGVDASNRRFRPAVVLGSNS